MVGSVVVAALGIVKLAVPRMVSAHHDADAPAATSGAAVPAVGPPAPPTPSFAPPYKLATLLGNGHVLLTERDMARDWDPFAPVPLREVRLGDAGPAHTFALTQVGGHRLVVAKSDESDDVRFELWDADRLTFLKDLGTYVVEEPDAVFSPDGKRLLILACTSVNDPKRACEAGVYEAADGALVHRTKLPPFPGDVPIVGRLSHAGTYFATSAPGVAPTAYESRSGRRVFIDPDDDPTVTDDFQYGMMVHFTFIDDRRMFTAAEGIARLTDLSTGKSVTRGFGRGMPRALIAPDHARAALQTSRSPGFAVALFSFDEPSAHEMEIPDEACHGFCAMRWSGPHELTFSTNMLPAIRQYRVDAKTGRGVIEDYREPPLLDDDAHPVRGPDFDAWGTTKWHHEGRSERYPKGALVTPSGVKIDLDSIDTSSVMSAAGDRFLMDGDHVLRLVDRDGHQASLRRAPSGGR